LATNHLLNWLKADVISLLKSVWLRWVTIRLVSSVNSTGLWLFPNTLARSFIHRRKSSGPSTDHWGTPHLTFLHLEKLLWQELLLVIDILTVKKNNHNNNINNKIKNNDDNNRHSNNNNNNKNLGRIKTWTTILWIPQKTKEINTYVTNNEWHWQTLTDCYQPTLMG